MLGVGMIVTYFYFEKKNYLKLECSLISVWIEIFLFILLSYGCQCWLKKKYKEVKESISTHSCSSPARL